MWFSLQCSIHIVQELLSLRRNWVPPHPTLQASSPPPPPQDPSGGRHTRSGGGGGAPIPTKGQETLLLYVQYTIILLYNLSTDVAYVGDQ